MDSLDEWSASRKAAIYTQKNTTTEQTHTQTSMYWVGFEPMIPVFERAKTVHALDCAATVTGEHRSYYILFLTSFYFRSLPDIVITSLHVLYAFSAFPIRDTCPLHSPIYQHPYNKHWWATSDSTLRILSSNAVYLTVKKVSHPFKTTGKIIISDILIFALLDRKPEKESLNWMLQFLHECDSNSLLSFPIILTFPYLWAIPIL
jgi:hypothetical protein